MGKANSIRFTFLNRYHIHLRVKFGFGREMKNTCTFVIRFQTRETTVMWFASTWKQFASYRSHPGLFPVLNIQRSARHKRLCNCINMLLFSQSFAGT